MVFQRLPVGSWAIWWTLTTSLLHCPKKLLTCSSGLYIDSLSERVVFLWNGNGLSSVFTNTWPAEIIQYIIHFTFFSTILFSLVLWLCKDSIMHAADLEKHPEYILWMITLTWWKQPQYITFCKASGRRTGRRCMLLPGLPESLSISVWLFYS